MHTLHPSIHPSIHPSTHPPAHPPSQPASQPFIPSPLLLSFIPSFLHSVIHVSSTHSSIHISVCISAYRVSLTPNPHGPRWATARHGPPPWMIFAPDLEVLGSAPSLRAPFSGGSGVLRASTLAGRASLRLAAKETETAETRDAWGDPKYPG